MWRILGFNIMKKEPSVTSISVQLPSGQVIQRYKHNNLSNTLSHLDHYFVCPIGSFNHDGIIRHFQDLTFEEYFSLFRLVKFDPEKENSANYFLEQVNQYGNPQMHVILCTGRFRHYARIRDVPPGRKELFYLHALLQLCPAASHSDARTVNGVEEQTFHDAVTALGLFANLNEADYAISEAIETLKTPTRLRALFVQILIDESTLTPLQCWNTFQIKLCRDFILRYPDVPQIAIDYGLDHIG